MRDSDGILPEDAEIVDARIEPTETLVKQTREAVERMRANEADEETVFGSIRVTRADSARGQEMWAAWKAGRATIYMDIEIDGQTYLLFSPDHR
jgi:dihydropteroate synthase